MAYMLIDTSEGPSLLISDIMQQQVASELIMEARQQVFLVHFV